MLVHSLLVKSVDLRRLGGSAGGNDVLRDRVDRCPEAPGEKKFGPFAAKGACDSTADRTSGAVEHCNLIHQHHLWFLFFVRTGPTRPPRELRPRLKLTGGWLALSPSRDGRIVRAVNRTDTATSGNWAAPNSRAGSADASGRVRQWSSDSNVRHAGHPGDPIRRRPRQTRSYAARWPGANRYDRRRHPPKRSPKPASGAALNAGANVVLAHSPSVVAVLFAGRRGSTLTSPQSSTLLISVP